MDFRYERQDGKKLIGMKGGADGCVNFEDPDNAGLA